MKEIRAGQAREKARNAEAQRLLKQKPESSRPAASSLPERDPFEASPTLSEGEPGGKQRVNVRAADSGVFRTLKLKALVRSGNGGVAQIQSGRDLITLYDGDEIALEGRRYTVEIHTDGVKFQERMPEGVEPEEGTEGEAPRQRHTGWVR